jgi:hypothetical protein
MLRRNNPEPMKISLYHLESDPSETIDGAAQHPHVLERIRQIMRSQHTPSEVFPFPPLDGPGGDR